MKKAGNDLIQFVCGLVMLFVGLFIFSQKVIVYSSIFGYGFSLGGYRVNSGLIIIPLIIGIVWMFVSGASFASKIMTVIGVLVIIISVIMSTNIRLQAISLYEWVLILVLIFGGAGLAVKQLLGGNSSGRGMDTRNNNSDSSKNNIDNEIEKIKKNLK